MKYIVESQVDQGPLLHGFARRVVHFEDGGLSHEGNGNRFFCTRLR